MPGCEWFCAWGDVRACFCFSDSRRAGLEVLALVAGRFYPCHRLAQSCVQWLGLVVVSAVAGPLVCLPVWCPVVVGRPALSRLLISPSMSLPVARS